MFELVSPETRVTIEYPEPALYYLGARSIVSNTEVQYPAQTLDFLFFPFVKLPRIYPLSSLEQCVNVANMMKANEEGFVVCDNYFNRIKIKSPEYLIASRIRNNNAITTRRVLEAMRAGYLDDLYAYAPDYQFFIDSVLNTYHFIADNLALAYSQACAYLAATPNLPWHAIVLKIEAPYRDFCFSRMANKIQTSYEYLEQMPFGRLVNWVKDYRNEV